MILNHLWGIYAHPKEEWQVIEQRHESVSFSLSHILIVALIPAIMGYYSAVHLGWSIGVGDRVMLSSADGIMMATAIYMGLVGGVFGLAYMIHWMSKTFDSEPTYTQALEIASYTATPLFMVGFAAFYPELWFIITVGLVGLSYSVYLLYTGVPIVMNIPEDKGFIYASSVVTVGLIFLVVLMTGSIVLWGWAFSPV
ncbi:YIP1 family protein [Paraneptunicella aestuarii]|uniref:Yip1 family protein n=1 Tax=Paraneptunicella aestuarii TaxID=2831148 RepID=UPI001E34BEC7|nr:Yip1 family protein [Paraneptunicella aestuarii]UAA40080.1 YIP1 family protein [Paraneptunicella aestuarii]